MDAALISKSSSGSVYTHCSRQTSSLALPFQVCPLKARAISPAVSRPPVVSASGFVTPRDEPV
ncbi:MAG: hypothetical protein DVB29_07150 [Verrucomicrobia bacterium]|nr:MAG: hypothetical protein DVB29_07150 [Verrucomicrobiota bacterium]